ncbi:membrane protein insertion efficiency factor YidD [Candidatus Gottesmanbacteria bacterium]|nr:membrane protein insertion efficiency factor YidD [Candidatus Gottesmanbacteria bacterium]
MTAKKILLKAIRLYQKYISPDTGFLKYFLSEGACRFTPTCSEYTYRAIDKYGIIKGSILGLKRIIRCHPWAKGGVDNIP